MDMKWLEDIWMNSILIAFFVMRFWRSLVSPSGKDSGFVQHLENFLRKYIFNLKMAGIILAVLIVGLTYFLVWGIIKAGYQLNLFWGRHLEVFLFIPRSRLRI